MPTCPARRWASSRARSLMQPNEAYTISFAKVPAGKYDYICTPHAAMNMKGVRHGAVVSSLTATAVLTGWMCCTRIHPVDPSGPCGAGDVEVVVQVVQLTPASTEHGDGARCPPTLAKPSSRHESAPPPAAPAPETTDAHARHLDGGARAECTAPTRLHRRGQHRHLHRIARRAGRRAAAGSAGCRAAASHRRAASRHRADGGRACRGGAAGRRCGFGAGRGAERARAVHRRDGDGPRVRHPGHGRADHRRDAHGPRFARRTGRAARPPACARRERASARVVSRVGRSAAPCAATRASTNFSTRSSRSSASARATTPWVASTPCSWRSPRAPTSSVAPSKPLAIARRAELRGQMAALAPAPPRHRRRARVPDTLQRIAAAERRSRRRCGRARTAWPASVPSSRPWTRARDARASSRTSARRRRRCWPLR